MTGQLEQRQSEAETKLATLRQERGAAALDGKKFDSTRIAKLNSDIETVTDAKVEQTRRERQKAESARQAKITELRASIAKQEMARQAALQEAEAGARKFVQAIGQALKINAEMAKLAFAISGESAPIPLQYMNFASRIAGRLSAVMGGIAGHRHRLGSLEWHGSIYREDEDWKETEAKLLERHLEPLLPEKG